jgi:Tol biopolymer transport system component
VPLGSPHDDQQSLYYAADNVGFSELHIVGIDMQGSIQSEFNVPLALPFENLVGLYPSPDGKYLAIGISYGPQDTSLYVMERSSGRIWCPLGEVEHCFGSFWDWTRDNRLLFSTTPGNTLEGTFPFSGVIVDISTGQYIRLDLPTSPDQAYSIARNVSSNPDGSRIAYTVTYFDENGREISEIWTMELDGGERQLVRKMEGVINALSWSPVDEQLAYFYRPGTLAPITAPSELWLINSDGTGNKLLANQTRNADRGTYGPAWSPDGHYIAFVQVDDLDLYLRDWREPGTNVYIANVTKGKVTRLSMFEGHSTCSPTWSPDGKFVAFVSSVVTGEPEIGTVPASAELWMANVEDGHLYPVSGTARYCCALAWLPPMSASGAR